MIFQQNIQHKKFVKNMYMFDDKPCTWIDFFKNKRFAVTAYKIVKSLHKNSCVLRVKNL